MSTLATTGAGPAPERRDRPGLVRLLAARDPGAIAAVTLLLLAFFAAFYRWFLTQHAFSWKFKEDWAHAYVVPLISGYYVWRHRKELLSAPSGAYWPGVTLMGLGISSYVYFMLGFPNHMFQGLGLLAVVSGVVLLVAGPRVFGVMAFPIGYLALGVTISERVMNAITFKLKMLASNGSHQLLTLIGIENDLSGNLLTIYDGEVSHPLNVADACSGMRMVIAFIALGVAVAFLSCRFWWQRIALMLLAVPVALLMNVLRVTVLGVMTLVDPDAAVGEAHTFIGTLLLVPAFGIFMACVWALNRMVIEESGRSRKKKAVGS